MGTTRIKYSDDDLNKDEIQLVTKYRKMSKDKQNLILTLAEML
jgi:hypothetical protein